MTITTIFETLNTVKDMIPTSIISLGISIYSLVNTSKRNGAARKKEAEAVKIQADTFINTHKEDAEYLSLCQIAAAISPQDIIFTRKIYVDFKSLPANIQQMALPGFHIPTSDDENILQFCLEKLEDKIRENGLSKCVSSIPFTNIINMINKYGNKKLERAFIKNPCFSYNAEHLGDLYPNLDWSKYATYAIADIPYEDMIADIVAKAMAHRSDEMIRELLTYFRYSEMSEVRQLEFALLFTKSIVCQLYGRAFYNPENMEDLFLSILFTIYNS